MDVHHPLLPPAKWAFTTRRVPLADATAVLPRHAATRAGQLVLARVERVGQHDGLQLRDGRRAELYADDTIVLCLGDRYAPDQFEGVAAVDPDGTCDLLAAGGVAGLARHRHARMKAATRLRVVGCLADARGQPLELARYALGTPALPARAAPVIVVAGSSMNAGKTTACAALVHGLAARGMRVGAAKLTGTGSFGDVQAYADAGAADVLDFTDAGYVSTYRVPVPQVEAIARTLVATLQARACDVIVAEVADGLYQAETAALFASRDFRAIAGGAMFAAADAMGAVEGLRRLRALGWPIAGLSGLVTCSPLACGEVEAALRDVGMRVPALTRDRLRTSDGAGAVLAQVAYRSLPLAA